MQRPVVVLPLPDSPTRPKVSPSLDREADVVDGADDARRCRRGRRGARTPSTRMPDFEQRHQLSRDRQDLRFDRRARGDSTSTVPVPPSERRSSPGCAHVGHGSKRSGHRGANAQPGGSWPSGGTVPWIACRRDPGAPPGIDASRPRVYGCFGSRNSSSHRRFLDDPAGVHDRDAVGHLGDHAEVVRDQEQREPQPLLQSRSRSRICAWMVTSSAVVGSSAMSSAGSQASAIAISARWRRPPESWCG